MLLFTGSDTTVANRKQNRNFIGIEKSKTYYQIALKRLSTQ